MASGQPGVVGGGCEAARVEKERKRMRVEAQVEMFDVSASSCIRAAIEEGKAACELVQSFLEWGGDPMSFARKTRPWVCVTGAFAAAAIVAGMLVSAAARRWWT